MQAPSGVTIPDGEVFIQIGTESEDDARKVALSNEKGCWYFGRNSDVCDVAVAYNTVSRVHARLLHFNGKFFLEDLGSVHGTFHNLKRLEAKTPVQIAPAQDRITFSDYDKPFVVHCTRTGPFTSLASAYESSDAEDSEPARSRQPTDSQPASGKQQHLSPKSDPVEGSHRDRQTDHPRSRRDGRDGERSSRHRRRSTSRDRYRSPESYRDRSRGSARRESSHRSDREETRRKQSREYRQRGSRSPDGRRPGSPPQNAVVQDTKPAERRSKFGSAPAVATEGLGQSAGVQSSAAAAELVRQMMGPQMGAAAGLHGLTAEQKKKMLWSSKKAAPPQQSSQAPVAAAPSTYNRWESAHFGSEEERSKFQKLMGIKGSAAGASAVLEAGRHEDEGVVPDGQKQSQLLHDLEHQYVSGLRRKDGRTVGLGL